MNAPEKGLVHGGGNMPEDFKVMLQNLFGVDLNRAKSFEIRCEGASEPLLVTTTCYVEEPDEKTIARGEFLTEARTFKLVAVE